MNAKEMKQMREEIALLKEKCELLAKLNTSATPKGSAPKSKPAFEWETVDKTILRNDDGDPTGYVLTQKKGKEERILFGGYVVVPKLRKGRTEDDGWFAIKKGDKKGQYWAPSKNPCVLSREQAKELLSEF